MPKFEKTLTLSLDSKSAWTVLKSLALLAAMLPDGETREYVTVLANNLGRRSAEVFGRDDENE